MSTHSAGDVESVYLDKTGTPVVVAITPDGVWAVSLALGVGGSGHLAFYGLRGIWPVSAEAGLPVLDTSVLRKLPLGRWLVAAHSRLATMPEAKEIWPEWRPAAEKKAELMRTSRPRRGRPSTPDERLRRVARAYLELQAQGVGRGIQKRLAKQENRPWQTIRDDIHRATELGYLSPGSPGRAGRMPGPNLDDDKEGT